MKMKAIFIELALLAVVVVAIWLVGTLLVDKQGLSINLHDTYFVITRPTVVVLPMPVILLLIYLLREAFYGYKRRLQNLILLSVNVLSIISTIFALKLVTLFFPPAALAKLSPVANGWTIYPPLSAQPQIAQAATYWNYPWLLIHLTDILTGAILLFVLILVIISVITGKNWNNRKYYA